MMIKGQSKYIREKNKRLWNETFGAINPLLKDKLEIMQGKWKDDCCLNGNSHFNKNKVK